MEVFISLWGRKNGEKKYEAKNQYIINRCSCGPSGFLFVRAGYPTCRMDMHHGYWSLGEKRYQGFKNRIWKVSGWTSGEIFAHYPCENLIKIFTVV